VIHCFDLTGGFIQEAMRWLVLIRTITSLQD